MGRQPEDFETDETVARKNTNSSSNSSLTVPPDRGAWGSQCEFIVASLGYAVGLGNIWRFPNMVFKYGGGAYLIAYFGLLFLIGVPCILLESGLGQFTTLGPVSMWKMFPVGKGIGVGMLINSFILSVYFNTPITYSFYYFIRSFANPLPWTVCTSDQCNANRTLIPAFNESDPNSTIIFSPAEDFYYSACLKVSPNIDSINTIQWELLACHAGIWVLVFLAICRGASSLGKVAYFTSLFPYAMLTAILIQVLMLPGAWEGILYYLETDFTSFEDPHLWKDALTSVFLSCGVASGGVVTLASYNKFDNNIFRDSILIPVLDGLTGFYAGFCVFACLGYLSYETGRDVEDVLLGGPNLLFIAYPEALATMPASYIWAVLFFFMCLTLGLSSQFPQIETMSNVLSEMFPALAKTRKRQLATRASACLMTFLFGVIFTTDAGWYWFNMVDGYVITYPVMMLTALESLTVGWFYGGWKLRDDVIMMTGMPYWAVFPFQICWMVIIPIVVLSIFFWEVVNFTRPYLCTTVCNFYPDWTIAVIWIMVAIPMLAVPIVGLIVFCKRKPDENVFRSDPTWGPKLNVNWYDRYAHLWEVYGQARPELDGDVPSPYDERTEEKYIKLGKY